MSDQKTNLEGLEGKAFEVWLQDLSMRAPSTVEIYRRELRRFLKRWKTTPDELYSMRKADVDSEDPRDHLRIERMVKTQMAEMQDSGYAAETCKQLKKAMSSFFESQGLDLKFKAKDSPKGANQGSRAITPEQILTMFDNMSQHQKLRNRAVVMGLKDTGLRISDFGALDVADYLDAEIVKNEAGETFRVFVDPMETKKMKVPAWIHMGPEAVEAIDRYLAERLENGELFGQDTPLILTSDGRRITRGTFTSIFTRSRKWLKNGGRKVSGHSYRKFHRTRLEGAGMPEAWVKKLQGKKASVYSNPEETGELTPKYLKCYDRLRVFGEPAPTAKIEKQATEIEKLQNRIKELETEKEAEITALRQEFKEIARAIFEEMQRQSQASS